MMVTYERHTTTTIQQVSADGATSVVCVWLLPLPGRYLANRVLSESPLAPLVPQTEGHPVFTGTLS